MPSAEQLGYDQYLIRTSGDVSLAEPVNPFLSGEPLNNSQVANLIPDNSIGYSQQVPTRVDGEDMQSSNFVTGSTGWIIRGDGSVEFSDGVFRGSLSAATIDIGGSDATSFHVDIDGNMWLGAGTFNISTNPFAVSNAGVIRAVSGTIGGWTLSSTTLVGGSATLNSTGILTLGTGNDIAALDASDSTYRLAIGHATYASAPFRVTKAGALTATSATISGSITATTGAIGGFDIGSDYIRDAANSMGMASTVTGSDDVRFWAGATFASRSTAPYRVTEAGAVTASNMTVTGGSLATSTLNGIVNQANLNLANRGWTQTCAFSMTDSDTVSWGSGTFTSADGTSYSISAGNTGNMAARTYIYLDINVSTTAYQTTTTASTAVGAGKVLIATAVNGSTEATFQVFGGTGGLNIDAANIVAGSITANEIAASTITGANILTLNISGKTATFDTGTIGGFTMSATTLSATNFTVTSGAANTANITVGSGSNAAGINSANGSSDIAFWAGATFASRASAPFYVTAGGALVATSATINGRAFTADPTFGDGSDGTVSLGAGTTTLTRDMFYDVLTVPNGSVLNPAGYRIFCKTSCTLSGNGAISRDGTAGNAGGNSVSAAITTGGAAPSALASGSIFGSLAGSAGGNGGGTGTPNGQPGGAGAATTISITNTAGVAGGLGKAGTNGTGGAAGAAGAVSSVALASPRNLGNALLMIDSGNGSALYRGSAGSGGGGGGGNSTGSATAGGAGGSSGTTGGIVFLAARTITIGASASITAIGGAGGAGGNSQNVTPESAAGSGGGGGGGGVIMLIYTTLSNSGTLSVAGGAGGAGGTNPANAAYSGNSGTSGNAGATFQLQLS